MEELAPDAIVHSHPASYVVYIASDRIAEVRDLVNESYLGREECICRIFDELSRFERSNNDRRFDQIKRPIKLLHYLDRFFFIATDNDSIRTHEITDRRALTQKFGIGCHAKVGFYFLIFADKLPQPLSGAYRNGRFSDQHFVADHRFGNVFSGLLIVAHVGRAVILGRCSYSKKDNLRSLDCGCEIGSEVEATFSRISIDHLIEPGLVYRNAALI